MKYTRDPKVLLPPLFASMTLGLAPFVNPQTGAFEPHVWGKILWVAGGAVGMGMMDWFDLLMHGAPWVWLIGATVLFAVGKHPMPRTQTPPPMPSQRP